MNKDRKATFRINTDDWEKFKKNSNQIGTDASNILRIFIKEFNKKKSLWFIED